ncbi:hypothetical protein D3C72_1068130 [compost metagenome]
MEQFAQIGEGFIVDALELAAAVAHLHDRHAGATPRQHFLGRLLQDFGRQRGRTGREIEHALGHVALQASEGGILGIVHGGRRKNGCRFEPGSHYPSNARRQGSGSAAGSAVDSLRITYFAAAAISFSAESRIDLPTCGPYFCIIEPQISWVALPWLAMNFWPVGDFRNVVRSLISWVL